MSGHETRKGGNGQAWAEARRESNCPRHKNRKARRRKIGICRHAPSDYPEFARFLLEQGIDSTSLNPDAVLKTPVKILEMEQAEPVLFCPHHFQIGANNLFLKKTPPTHFIALDWPFL